MRVKSPDITLTQQEKKVDKEVVRLSTIVKVEVESEDVMRVMNKLSPMMAGNNFCLEVKAKGFKYKAPKRPKKKHGGV